MTSGVAGGALTGTRVVDMTGPDGHYCGKLLAELGADVILVEPPSGSALRHRGPWLHGVPGLERSLAFSYLNTSKRSVVLDLATADDRARLQELLSQADLLLDSAESPQTVEDAGLNEGPGSLTATLVRTSITPFGLDGPYAGRPASDLTCLAEGGMLSLVGYPDQPLGLPYEQAYLAAGQFAAVGSLIALLERQRSGRGQRVDVSVQEAVTLALENAAQTYDLEGTVRHWVGPKQRMAGAGMFACGDGYVLLLAGGVGGNRFWPNLLRMMEDLAPGSTAQLRGDDWTRPAHLASRPAKRTFRRVFEEFAAGFSMDELNERARSYRVPLAPVNTVARAAASEQLASRGFFVDLDVDGVITRMPGAPYQLSGTPWRTTHRAPRLGEHTRDVVSVCSEVAATSLSGPGGVR